MDEKKKLGGVGMERREGKYMYIKYVYKSKRLYDKRRG